MRYSNWQAFAKLQSWWRRTKTRPVPRGVKNCQNSAMSGLTARKLPVVCGVGGGHLHKECPAASWWTERNLIPQTIEAAGTTRKRCEGESRREHTRLQREGCSLPATPSQGCPSQQCYAATQQLQQPQPPSAAQACPAIMGEMSASLPWDTNNKYQVSPGS
jgi:hypothetical protein